MKNSAKQAWHGAKTLGIFTFLFTLALASIYWLTHDAIKNNEATAQSDLITQTLAKGSYDNNLLHSVYDLPSSAIVATDIPQAKVWVATLKQKHVAYVFEAIAPNGYGGKIKLLIGIKTNGQVSGVRVIQHKETPGLGDYIDRHKSHWIDQFTGKSANNNWKVKKDGGDFDYMSGATISARAVVGAVGKVVTYYQQNQAWFENLGQ